ncbi:MAG: undecaprenyl/decaprenyl-phosphate alpha-N-acetylglucosaminyl 1-phosphate transferase [Chloroflexi bacterium]|nr:undecaprenyl/decaprenyl-phosphate alpha-N-acetylglucosaminyl 1-phosphate transferase [Chloroflexota bacterium]
MSQFIPLILASGLISFIATPLVKRFAQSINFVDKPHARKLHITPTPLLGGVAIYVGLVTTVLISCVDNVFIEMAAVIGGATIMTATGVIDDRFTLAPLPKLGGQLLATAILILAGIQVQIFASPILNIAITVLWVIGICNAINFQDNMDGLAAGLSMVAAGFFFIIASNEGLGLVATLAAATAGACVGFLYYNFNPAQLFMGDAGSLLLGFVLAILGIKLEFVGRPQDITWMIPIIILGVPIFDMALVIISRLRRGIAPYHGGKDHTSHRLANVIGMPTSRAVMTLYLVAAALGLLAVMLPDANRPQALMILSGLALLFIAALVWLEWRFAQYEAAKAIEAPAADG